MSIQKRNSGTRSEADKKAIHIKPSGIQGLLKFLIKLDASAINGLFKVGGNIFR